MCKQLAKPVPGVMNMQNSLISWAVKMTLKMIVEWFSTGQCFALRLFQDVSTSEKQVKANGEHTYMLWHKNTMS